MPQISHTPESLLPRSDSRNPASTCRGITAQGRPCRRALASQTPSSASGTRKRGIQDEVADLASFYCWQHKDQVVSPPLRSDTKIPAKPRSSIDTLMDRLGVLDIKDEKPPSQRTHQRRPKTAGAHMRRRTKPKSTFCCFEIADEDEDVSPFRPLQKPVSNQIPHGSFSTSLSPHRKIQRPTSAGCPQHLRVPSSGALLPGRPPLQNARKSSSSSQTQALLSWIPSSKLSPQTTSLLLAELDKPISDADEEGYIYMFWVTPPTATVRNAAQSPVPRDIASSLLPSASANSNSLRPSTQPRSVSDAIQAARELNALTSNPTSNSAGTIRLKIGRTSNVHRRLNEWTRQCSYDLTLIRYYPYTSSSSASSSPARTPQSRKHGQEYHNSTSNSHLLPGRKVPHVHRVERLIHIELADLRVRDLGRCSECGKEHREWFEVAAAKEALRNVDECVRRWVQWGESKR